MTVPNHTRTSKHHITGESLLTGATKGSKLEEVCSEVRHGMRSEMAKKMMEQKGMPDSVRASAVEDFWQP